VGTLSETSIISSNEASKMHKRFKLDNGENNQQEGCSPSINSEEPNFHVTREVSLCDSPALNSKEQKNISLPGMLHLFKIILLQIYYYCLPLNFSLEKGKTI